MGDQTGSPSSSDPINEVLFQLNEIYRENPGEYLRDDDKIAVDILDRQFK